MANKKSLKNLQYFAQKKCDYNTSKNVDYTNIFL